MLSGCMRSVVIIDDIVVAGLLINSCDKNTKLYVLKAEESAITVVVVMAL